MRERNTDIWDGDHVRIVAEVVAWDEGKREFVITFTDNPNLRWSNKNQEWFIPDLEKDESWCK